MSNTEHEGRPAQKPDLTGQLRELTIDEINWFVVNDPDAFIAEDVE